LFAALASLRIIPGPTARNVDFARSPLGKLRMPLVISGISPSFGFLHRTRLSPGFGRGLYRSLLQRAEQRLRLLQIARVEAFGEPAVNLTQQFAHLLRLALIAPETRKGSWRRGVPRILPVVGGQRRGHNRRKPGLSQQHQITAIAGHQTLATVQKCSKSAEQRQSF
jgi:hypothetical protein